MKRNKFSLSHYRLFSCNQGALIPISLVETLPGDTIQQATSALVRVAPLVSPVMHPVHARIHHWFVPYRLLWDNWEDFITGGPDGMDASAFPRVQLANPAIGSLADYMGVPTGTYTPSISAMPFRAYALIFNEFYRDQDLVAPLPLQLTDGLDGVTNQTLQNVAWEKDYFTSARPWEQKGPAVTVPVGGMAPVVPVAPGISEPLFTVNGVNRRLGMQSTDPGLFNGAAVPGAFQAAAWSAGAGASGLQADLSGATGVTINQLRESFAIQRYEEARARYGSRYSEYLRYLSVRSSDARLQRPEYLGGGKQTIQFSEVLQTAEGANPVGTMRGHGIGAMRSNRYRRFFEEHGMIISLMSVKPRTVYMQKLDRHWLHNIKEDFWQKELEHIGQQEIANYEIYAPTPTPGTFGYQDRYDQYRRKESGVSGEFRTTLNYWHMARDFSSQPILNASFVQANPTNRIYAATTAHQLYVMAMNSIQARRQLAKTGSSFIY